MNAKNLKEWLLDVPDNAVIVAIPSDELPKTLYNISPSAATYNIEPIYFEGDKKVVFVFGI